MSRIEPAVVPLIESRIFLIRGQKVLLDADLATLYEVETKALNRAVKRNRDRFPEDFMFQLTAAETQEVLRYQIGTQTKAAAAAATGRTCLRSRESPCSRAS